MLLNLAIRPFFNKLVYETADLKNFFQVQYIIIHIDKIVQMSQDVSLPPINLFGPIILGYIRNVYRAFM
jgi:hypothetical protein